MKEEGRERKESRKGRQEGTRQVVLTMTGKKRKEVYVCMYVCMHLCMHVCKHVFMCMVCAREEGRKKGKKEG